VDDEDALRHLELCQPAVERLQHRGLGDVGALVADENRRHAFAEIGMRNADHGGFDHARHGVDLALDFLRIDVEAAGDHEVLAAAEDMDVALVVDLAEVAGDEEAIGPEFRLGLLRHAPVALEYVRALDLDHADLVARQLLAGLGLGDAYGDAG